MKKITLLLILMLCITACRRVSYDDDWIEFIINEQAHISSDRENLDQTRLILANFIRKHIDEKFNVNHFSFQLAVSEQEEESIFTYDFNLFVGAAITRIGYTVVTTDNTILTIYDRMLGFNANRVIRRSERRVNRLIDGFNEDKREQLRLKAIPEGEEDIKTIESEFFYFNVIRRNLYYVINVLVFDPETETKIKTEFKERI